MFLHGHIPSFISLIFTLANGYILAVFLSHFSDHNIHKCAYAKLAGLNLSSIVFAIYVFRYVFNF